VQKKSTDAESEGITSKGKEGTRGHKEQQAILLQKIRKIAFEKH